MLRTEIGAGDLSAPAPNPERVDPTTLRYTLTAAGRTAVIDVSQTICADTMTGMPFPQTLIVTVDGYRLAGCGGDSLEVIRGEWQVERIDDLPIVDGSKVTLVFVDPNLAHGQASCNRFVTNFTLNGEGLSIGPVTSTDMACLPAWIDQEHLFFEVLAQIARRTIGEGGKLILHSRDARTIVARRVY